MSQHDDPSQHDRPRRSETLALAETNARALNDQTLLSWSMSSDKDFARIADQELARRERRCISKTPTCYAERLPGSRYCWAHTALGVR